MVGTKDGKEEIIARNIIKKKPERDVRIYLCPNSNVHYPFDGSVDSLRLRDSSPGCLVKEHLRYLFPNGIGSIRNFKILENRPILETY